MTMDTGSARCFDGLESMENSPLAGGTIAVLGSSVFAADEAVGEYLAARFDARLIKEAVSGTTLCDAAGDSYVSRISRIDPNAGIDLFLCQLSTNDATLGMALGAVSGGMDIGDFDVNTTAGALEYIIAHVKRTWNCPMAIVTGTRYASEAYARMVDLAGALGAKWGIGVIDLWHDEALNAISDERRAQYIAEDGIHPTALGYRDWWGPAIERGVLDCLAEYR